MEDVLLLNDDHTQLLYHYTEAETAKLILESGNIRLGKLRNVNEPKAALMVV